MNTKKIITVGIIILIIAIGISGVMATSVNYEKIEITPNGTSIEIPAEQTKYQGDIEGFKIWNWDNGILVTYNSYNISYITEIIGMGNNILNILMGNEEMQNISGFQGYVIDAEKILKIEIFENISLNKYKFYCIPLTNETTQDNIIIFCDDKDMAVHMAKSVKYKNVYPDNKNSKIKEEKFEPYQKKPVAVEAYQTDEELELETLEGTMKADAGDWIIKGEHGEYYPCKPDVFNLTYEKVGN